MSLSKKPEALKDSFQRKELAQKEDVQTEVPERIKNHAPTPRLRPKGSWSKRADEVDRSVREKQEASKARNEWAKRLKSHSKDGKGLA